MTDHSDWEFFQDEGYFGMWCVREKGARRFGEGFHTVSKEEAEALAYALSSQSLSLSEAREEIERLKGLVAGIRECPQEPSGEKLLRARNHWLREAEQLREQLDKVTTELAWYGEQARLARLIHREGDAGRHALAADGGKRAQKALENGPAGLADAHTNPPLSDLSSLRKGAEVAVTDAARDLLFHLELYDFSERDPSGELNEKMGVLKTALVSGSREEQS